MTAAFLLIMGAVSTIVLSKRLGSEFNAQLVAAAAAHPAADRQQSRRLRGGRDHLPPGQVRPLTGDSAATRELAASVQNLITRRVARYYIGGRPFRP